MDNLCREHATTLSAAIIPTAEGLCNMFRAREIVAALGPVRGYQKRSAALGEPITPKPAGMETRPTFCGGGFVQHVPCEGNRSSFRLRERPPEALRGVGRTHQPQAGGYGNPPYILLPAAGMEDSVEKRAGMDLVQSL